MVEEFQIETVDMEDEQDVGVIRAKERESLNEKFSWGWFRLPENQITQTDESQTTEHAVSTEKCKQWLVTAIVRPENQSFDDVCAEVARLAKEEVEKVNWMIKITFSCAVVTKKDYKMDEDYKKWWYYEFDLNGEQLFVFICTFHGNSSQIQAATSIIESMREQAPIFTTIDYNHVYEP